MGKAIRFHQPESRIQFEHPWPRPMVTTDGHNSAFYLTNARELQDVPGEWYHDMDARKVYYYPREGEKMQEAEVIVPAVETLVRVEGTVDRPVCHIRFEKITFSYTTWMRPSEKGHVPLQAGMYLTCLLYTSFNINASNHVETMGKLQPVGKEISIYDKMFEMNVRYFERCV